MEEISVKGKTYVKAKVIARELGYTNDYVGQLCRGGKVDAELVGRTWYVDPTSIKSHKENRYRSTKATTSREIKNSVSSAPKGNPVAIRTEPANFYTKKHKVEDPIAYENDDADLLPTPGKGDRRDTNYELPVELADAEKLKVADRDGKDYHFTAPKRQETKFFGTLKVTEFMTEVKVDGDDEKPHSVKVTGKINTEPKPQDNKEPETEKINEPEVVHKVELHRLTHRNPKPRTTATEKISFTPRSIAMPVTGEGEVATLPLKYHLITVTALVASLLIATVAVALESNVTATVESVSSHFTFAIDNISALIFLVK